MRRLLRPVLPLLLTLALLALPAVGQVPDPPVETVALRFGWADGDGAAVRVERVSTGPGSALAPADGRLRAESHAEGLALRFEGTATALGPLAGSWLVDRDGAFVRTLDPAMDEPIVRQAWDALIGIWSGADVDLGDVYHLASVEPLPGVTGVTVPVLSEVRVSRAACSSAEAELACVRLRLIMRPDAVAMRLMLDGAAGEVWEALEWEVEADVVARPESLHPLGATIIRRLRGVRRDGGETSEVDHRRYTFDWGAS